MAASALAPPLRAQRSAWPDGPLRITLAYPPGGLSDSVVRELEHVRQASGGRYVHVPYKGGGPQINEALGGQFQVLSSNNLGPPQIELVTQGRLQALAVGAPATLAVLPDVARLAQLGFEAANLGSVFGIFAPAATEPARLDRINRAVDEVLRDGPLRARLLAAGSQPLGGPRASFVREIEADTRRHGPLIRQAWTHFK